MKYLSLFFVGIGLASCYKTQECHRCNVAYTTYKYATVPVNDTSYNIIYNFCSVAREFIVNFKRTNSDTIDVQNRKDANGNFYTESYARKVTCERYFNE